MAKALRSYLTSIGFFDLAVAAPSMKAALTAWGAGSNLFHQGMAREADDPAIIQATLKKPGVVLKRAVGSTDPFTERPKLSRSLPGGDHGGTDSNRSHRKEAETSRAATVLSEREEKRQRRDRQREKAAKQKREARRFQAVAKAEAAVKRAESDHKTKVTVLEKEGEALERRFAAEEARWEKLKDQLEADVLKARQ